MRYFIILLLICVAVSFAACESRVSAPNQETGPAQPPDTSQPISAEPALPEPAAIAEEPQRDVITDLLQVTLARDIVSDLLSRANVADEIYRAQLLRDDQFDPIPVDESYYLPVIDERFFTVQDIQTFLETTFIRGGEAIRRFDALQQNYAVYMSLNGELFVNTEQRTRPLTLGGWQVETMELLLKDDFQIEVRMQTTLLGIPDGTRTLRIIRDGDNWLLGDSFFFD